MRILSLRIALSLSSTPNKPIKVAMIFPSSLTPLAAWAVMMGVLLSPITRAEPTLDIELLASSCVNCHSPKSNPSSVIPSLAGKPESLLLAQLTAFQSDSPPPHTTVMDRLTRGLSHEELTALARYFSQTTKKAQED